MTVNYRSKLCHDDWYDRYWHLTLVIAFARAIPGRPLSFFVFRPRTSYFWRLTWTSKGFSAFFFWESALTTFSDRRFRFALFWILPIIYNNLNATNTTRTHVRTHTKHRLQIVYEQFRRDIKRRITHDLSRIYLVYDVFVGGSDLPHADNSSGWVAQNILIKHNRNVKVTTSEDVAPYSLA